MVESDRPESNPDVGRQSERWLRPGMPDFASKFNQIGAKWDKFGTSEDQFSDHFGSLDLQISQISPICANQVQ